jgi:hypothetical protein
MAKREELDRIVGKIMTDPAFRMQFAADPAAAAKSLNITLTPEQEASFKHNINAFIQGATELERGASQQAAAAGGHVIAIFKQ